MLGQNTILRFGEYLGGNGAMDLLQGVGEQLHRHGRKPEDNMAKTLITVCYNLKCLASFLEKQVDLFVKTASPKRQPRALTAKPEE